VTVTNINSSSSSVKQTRNIFTIANNESLILTTLGHEYSTLVQGLHSVILFECKFTVSIPDINSTRVTAVKGLWFVGLT